MKLLSSLLEMIEEWIKRKVYTIRSPFSIAICNSDYEILARKKAAMRFDNSSLSMRVWTTITVEQDVRNPIFVLFFGDNKFKERRCTGNMFEGDVIEVFWKLVLR